FFCHCPAPGAKEKAAVVANRSFPGGMTPQSSFMVVAPLDRSRVAGLRELLASMNSAQGQADPANPVLPFGQLETLHFARIVLLDDQTMDDITAYRMPRVDYPLQLAFLGDFDGDYNDFLSELNARGGAGLRRIFSYCPDFSPDTELIGWMRDHEHRPSTYYANW